MDSKRARIILISAIAFGLVGIVAGAVAVAYSIGAGSHESAAQPVAVATQPAKVQPQQTVAPTSAPVDPPPVNEPQAPNCATGNPGIGWGVSFSDGMNDTSYVLFTGLVQNSSDTPIQVLGSLEVDGFNAAGERVAYTYGVWDQSVNDVLPNQRITFKGPLVTFPNSTLATVTSWQFNEQKVGANWLGLDARCNPAVDLRFVDMGG